MLESNFLSLRSELRILDRTYPWILRAFESRQLSFIPVSLFEPSWYLITRLSSTKRQSSLLASAVSGCAMHQFISLDCHNLLIYLLFSPIRFFPSPKHLSSSVRLFPRPNLPRSFVVHCGTGHPI